MTKSALERRNHRRHFHPARRRRDCADPHFRTGSHRDCGPHFSRQTKAVGVPIALAALWRNRRMASTLIDQVMLSVHRAPASYTGEDLVEISCHGGILVTRAVLEACLRAGARAARPGEFTERAFLNGKMDLTQAEAVIDLIRAQTDLALRSATEQLEGRLGDAIRNDSRRAHRADRAHRSIDRFSRGRHRAGRGRQTCAHDSIRFANKSPTSSPPRNRDAFCAKAYAW